MQSKKAVRAIELITLATMANGNIDGAVMILFALELKASVFEIGLIAASGAYASVVSRTGFGLLSDKIGRKPVLMLGLLFGSVASILGSISYAPSLLIVVNVLEYLRWSAYFSSGLALIADVSPDADRSKSITIFTLVSSAGLLIGPAFASLALLFISIRQLFYVSSALSLLMLVVAQITMPSPHVRRSSAGITASFKSILKKRELVMTGWLIFLYFFIDNTLVTYIPVFASNVVGLTDPQVALLVAVRASAMTGIRFFVLKMESLVGRRRLLRIASLGLLISAPLIGFGGSLPEITLLYAIFGAAEGASFPLMIVTISDFATPSERGLANALCLALGDSAAAISPLAMGAIIQTMGLTMMFAWTGFPIVALMVSALKLPIRSKEQE